MSRQAVRQAVSTWIAAANVANLNQIFTSHPKRINFQTNSTAGQMTRAAAVVFINGETEKRIALGGASSGWKQITYDVTFQIFTHSLQSDSVVAMNEFDAIVDAVKAQLRAGGHRLNQPNGDTIWQAAEPEITVDYGEPQTNNGGATEIWAGINFAVLEMIQA
jgi:hypothetical protein